MVNDTILYNYYGSGREIYFTAIYGVCGGGTGVWESCACICVYGVCMECVCMVCVCMVCV